MITAQDLVAAKVALGGQLAAHRHAASLHQATLAQRVFISRSTIANVERGRQIPTREFWEACDEALACGGRLVAGFDELEALRQRYCDQAVKAAEMQRSLQTGAAGQDASVGIDSGHAAASARHAVRTDAAGGPWLDDGYGGGASSSSAPASGGLGAGPVDDRSDAELIELALVVDRRGISAAALIAAEVTCERLDLDFARLAPDEVLGQVRMVMRVVVAQLGRSQTLSDQRRLVALAGRLAGLRAWACFDVDEHGAAERWYGVAVTAAQEAEAWSLGAWLLGAQSLIPWHRRERRRALALIERGIHLAGLGADRTTLAWLHALHARGQASVADHHGFEIAYARAQEAAEYSSERDRRHGMDFDQGVLDLRYYAGTGRLLLHQPDRAAPPLRGSLAALPASHTKARAVLTLTQADAALQSDDVHEAIDLTRNALVATAHQPIMPILQQARRLRRLIAQRDPTACADLDAEVDGFAQALTRVATRVEQCT